MIQTNSPDWLVLEHTSGDMPDIRAAALVSKEIRDTILSGYRRCGMGECIPSTASGHTQEGAPTADPHLAIIPLAFAGYLYADGHLVGFALVPPRATRLLEDHDFLRVLRKLTAYASAQGRRELRLCRFGLSLSPTSAPTRRSLDSAEYTKESYTFATVTPIVLDRHLKKNGSERQDEIAGQIKLACQNIGLPEPRTVVPDKYSAIEGIPPAQPSGKAPEWMRWRLPHALASRMLTHAVIQFSSPVKGPLVLGAGRFVGLGLCRPIAGGESRACPKS